MKTEERITKTAGDGSETLAAGKGRRFLKTGLGLGLLAAALGAGYNYYQLHHETTEGEIARIESLIVAGKDEEARALMISAQTRSLHLDALRLRIGRAFLREGRLGPATALLSKVEGSLIKEERLAIAEYFLGAGDPFSAVRFYEAAMRTGVPRGATLLGRYGEAQSLAGNAENAVAAFKEALSLDASRVRVRLNLAVTLANMNQFGEARAETLAVLKSEPENPKALQLLAALGELR
ncbi:MAG: tetratricopeptide repeat protein [Vicinamibacteria bacterium]|nr:tetratricopeptide repeat protein [Vicinamibacteria bacterium]